MLTSADLASVERAIVVVKGGIRRPSVLPGWKHAGNFSLRGTQVFQQAARVFGEATPLKILVVPALPHEAEARDESIAVLRTKGMDAVIPFRTMLTDLVAKPKSTAITRNPTCSRSSAS